MRSDCSTKPESALASSSASSTLFSSIVFSRGGRTTYRRHAARAIPAMSMTPPMSQISSSCTPMLRVGRCQPRYFSELNSMASSDVAMNRMTMPQKMRKCIVPG